MNRDPEQETLVGVEEPAGEVRERRKSAAREWLEALAVAVLLALFIRTFVVQAFKIPSGSMIPTLLVGDHIREADDPLDEVPPLIIGILEDDDISPPRGPGAKNPGIEHGNADSVCNLAPQEMVPNQEGRDHGPGGDLEGLNH